MSHSHDSHVPRCVLMLVVVAVWTSFTCTVLGQITSARPDRGTMPNGSYSVSDFENVSLQNGNVNLSIPLASLPPIAGGKLSWTLSAQYNSKVWDVVRTQAIGQDFNLSPHYYEIDSVQLSPNGGWRITGQYTLEIRSAEYDFDYELPPVADQDYPLMVNHTWYKVVLVMPDGAEHELRALDYSPFPGGKEYLRGYYKESPYTNGSMRYYSFDGSYLYATIAGPTNWTVYLPDGTRIIQTPDNVQRIQDTNGNRIKIFTDSQGTHYQDEQTNREIRYFFDPVANNNKGQGQVFYQTVTGVWMRVDINFGTTSVVGQLYKVNDWVHGQTSEQPCQRHALLSRTFQVVDEIVFPQTEPNQPNRRFSFSYNSTATETATNNARFSCSSSLQPYTRQASKGWGSISKIVTPSGAEIEYSYSLDSGGSSFSHLPFTPDDIAGETITKKTIVQDGPDDVWTYQISENSAVQTYLPDNTTIQEQKYAQGTAMGTGFGGSIFGKSGLVYRTIKPFVRVERHWTNLAFDGASLNSPGGTINFNCVVDAEYTTLTDAAGNALKMSAKTFTYDYNGNVITTTDFDWFDPALVTRDAEGVPTGVPSGATVLRVTNNSYYNAANSSSSANVYAKRSGGAPMILNAVRQVTLGPSIVRFSYDGQPFDVAPTIGNLTSKSVWDDLDNKWITTSNAYDLYGNVISTTDGRGKVTQYFYDDATHSLPTRIVVDPQNGTGTQTTTNVYDLATGLLLFTTDPNGQQSTIEYINQLTSLPDPFGRPAVTKTPAVNVGGIMQRRRVTTTYLDSARQVIVAADLNAENDQLLKTRTTADTLGRTTLTEQTEDGINYTISARNVYLDMGRVVLSSSAMRGGASSTDSWTRVTRDSAGRVIEVANFGGATQPAWTGTGGVFTGAVTTSYSANFTTVTDQAGKVRRSMVDGLGRLIRVDEPDGSNNLGSTSSPVQPTIYAYDVFGNQTAVTQGAQTRSFTYDSLSRLRTAVNVENGTISYLYDDNGNLIVKTDNRGVSTHFAYDSINRMTRRWYNDSNSPSDTIHDAVLPGGVEPTDEVNLYYDALPSIGGPSYSPGPSIGRLVAQTYGSGPTGDYFAYDNLGRQTLKYQKTGATNYLISATYNLSGALIGMTYPSGHTISNSVNQAGGVTAFSGNLGDGITRTYSTGILYGPTGVMVKEQFGTDTAIYNKLFFNSRGQLAEIRTSTSYTGPTDIDANRGAIVNYYSGSGVSDNNGNLRKQEILLPGQTTRVQEFEYDSLNRLTSALEKVSGNPQWSQTFNYDRWGNRAIASASGTDLSNKQFTINTTNNRYGVPAGQTGVMQYDAAGNLTNDTYSGGGVRKYNAENKMTYAMAQNGQAQLYVYDGSGHRIKRILDGVETWQVYGLGGELIAEYAANGAAASPQREYGYRNGQLLITADAPAIPPVNVASAANGATATASSTYAGFGASGVINGDRKGLFVWQDGFWSTAVAGFPAWLEVQFNGSKVISEIDVVTAQDNYNAPIEPGESTTFSQYGLTSYQVQYWNGAAWTTISNGSVSGNNKVWRKFTFPAVTTTKIRVLSSASPDNYSRLTEVEAWTGPSPAPRYNLALNAAATASSSYAGWGAGSLINGDRKSLNAGNNGGWVDAGPTSSPDWAQIDFGSNKTVTEIDVFTLQDNWGGSVEPTESMTFTQWGLTGYDVQYFDGSNWVTVTNGSVSGNNKIWRRFTFAAISTSKIRVVANASPDGYSRLTEIEAYGPADTGGSSNGVQWLVSDQLGTPRIVFDQTGDLAKVRRHDYAPFGEELISSGGRASDPAYGGGDRVRQQFTSKERDFETGLDYFLARYYSSTQGRFTGVDSGPFTPADPQNLNRYSYTQNNPLKFVDPTGRKIQLTGDKVQDFIDYVEKKGIKLKYKTKDGMTTITGASINKDFKGNKEFAKLIKAVASSSGTAKFNVSSGKNNESGQPPFFDDNGLAFDLAAGDQKTMRPGNVNMASIQSVDSQDPDFAMALVGHFLIEGVEMRADGANYGPGSGAHQTGLDAESRILSEATGAKQQIRHQSPDSVRPGEPVSFVYTTVQYDVTIKNDGSATVNRVSPPTTPRPKQ